MEGLIVIFHGLPIFSFDMFLGMAVIRLTGNGHVL
jgi:hypothetical protein